MKILTSEQMKEIDRQAIEEFAIPGIVLMENAGRAIFEEIVGRFPLLKRQRIIIVAGKGNNGGDGFAVSRYLAESGVIPAVYLVGKKGEVKGDSAVNLAMASRLGIEIKEITVESDLAEFRTALNRATIIVDALFGTGLVRPLTGLYVSIIEAINSVNAYVVSIDIPSGLSSDTFEVKGPAVKADLTVTLAAPKIAHIFPPASELVGELVVRPIGIPEHLFEKPELKVELVDKMSLFRFFGPRARDTHKGTYGHLLIVAGSVGKTGAASLCGKAALRMGAGLVTVATAKSALPVVARSMPELMTEPLPETPAKTIAYEALTRVLSLLKGKDGLVIGPGLSTDPSTARFVHAILPKVKVPMVVDADALNIIANDVSVLGRINAPAVLTPHPGEFSRLTGLSTEEVLRQKLELVPDFAAKNKIYLVLKGYRTLIGLPSGYLYVNPTGNPGLATGGTGDVLSGLLGAQVVQEKDIAGAVVSAVYVHGLAGDLAAASLSEKSLTASDVIKFLPKAIKQLSDEALSIKKKKVIRGTDSLKDK